jgi:predicted transcriptional regulator
MSNSITIRLDNPEVADRIDALAKAMDRSRNWVLNRAVDEYLAVQSWQIAKIEEGLAAARRGDIASDDDVAHVLAKYTAIAKHDERP